MTGAPDVDLRGALGVFGGTFDPIHVAHLAVAEAARDSLGLQRVLFIPAGEPPHKRDRPITPAAHRLAMVEAAIADNPGFATSRIERLKFLELPRVGVEEANRHYSISTVATAIAAIPSPRPIAPSPSFVVALMLTRAVSRWSAAAIFSRMAGMCGAIFGASAINVASTFTVRARI